MKAELEAELEGTRQLATALDCAADVVTDKTVRGYVERFEELLDNETQNEMRAFLGDFMDRIELHGTKRGRRKPRKVCIHGKMPEFTRIGVASRTVASSNSSVLITAIEMLRGELREAA